MESNGINGVGSTTLQLGGPGEYAEPAPLSNGSPEELIAQIAVRLEEAGARDADVARQMRRARTRENRAALDERRKAAKLQLAAGLVQAGAQAAQGAANIGSASRDLQAANANNEASQFDRDGAFLQEQYGAADVTTQRAGELASASRMEAAEFSASSKRLSAGGGLMGAAAEASGSLLGYFGERASIAAAQHENEAEVWSESAQASDDARESSQRFADKALQHLADIEEAKHRAMMAALRG